MCRGGLVWREDTVQRAASDVQASASSARTQSWEKAQNVPELR